MDNSGSARADGDANAARDFIAAVADEDAHFAQFVANRNAAVTGEE